MKLIQLIFSLAVFLAESNAQSCKEGSNPLYGADGAFLRCVACEPGTFKDTNSPDACELCDAGTFSDSSGATSCSDCEAGTFSRSGSSNCTPCAPGTVTSTARAGTCTSCSPGTFASDFGLSRCEPCDYGTYSSVSGARTCTTCPSGTWTNGENGRDRCVVCPAGMAGTDGSCTACAEGTYQPDPGKTQCVVCANGTTNSEATECVTSSTHISDTTVTDPLDVDFFLETVSISASFDAASGGSSISTTVAVSDTSTDETHVYSSTLYRHSVDNDCDGSVDDIVDSADGLFAGKIVPSSFVTPEGRQTLIIGYNVTIGKLSSNVYSPPGEGSTTGQLDFCQVVRVARVSDGLVMNQVRNHIRASIELRKDLPVALIVETNEESSLSLDPGVSELETTLEVTILDEDGNELQDSDLVSLSLNDVLRFRVSAPDDGVSVANLLDLNISPYGGGGGGSGGAVYLVSNGFVEDAWTGNVGSSCGSGDACDTAPTPCTCDTTVRLPADYFSSSTNLYFTLSGSFLMRLAVTINGNPFRLRDLRLLQDGENLSDVSGTFKIDFNTMPIDEEVSSAFSVFMKMAQTACIVATFLIWFRALH